MPEPTSQYIPDIYTAGENGTNGQRATVDSNGWQSLIAPDRKVMPRHLVDQGLELLGKWGSAFPREDTWIQQEVGLPSLVVRIDATEAGEELKPYEVEERPGGIGLAYDHNDTFRDRLDRVKKTWPQFGVVVSDDPRRRGNDDDKWAQIVDKKTSGLVLVRAEPNEIDYHHLEGQSVSSLKKKGDKRYGVELGLWQEVSDPDELPWDESFVMKPLAGSKTKDVLVWLPKDQQKRFTPPGSKGAKGVHTRTKIVNALGATGSMYVQPFHPPMETDDPDHKFEIFRVFYGYDMEEDKWVHLGGFTNARNNLIVHGASDTMFHTIE